MEYCFAHFQKLCQPRAMRLVFSMVFVAFVVITLQMFAFPYGDILSLNSTAGIFESGKGTLSSKGSSSGPSRIGDVSVSDDSRNYIDQSVVLKDLETETLNAGGNIRISNETRKIDRESEKDGVAYNDLNLDEDQDPDNEFSLDLGNGFMLNKSRDPDSGFVAFEEVQKLEPILSPEKFREPRGNSAFVSGDITFPAYTLKFEKSKIPDNTSVSPQIAMPPGISLVNNHMQEMPDMNSSVRITKVTSSISSSSNQVAETPPRSEKIGLIQGSLPAAGDDHSGAIGHMMDRRKEQRIKTLSLSEMNNLLLKNRASTRSMRSRWPSALDQQILRAKAQIENAPIVNNDRELYAPAFRNFSMFKRSYELMEQMLKVYVYREGQKPIFHQPLLKGIYASEGWFMKLMEENTQFVVDDPRMAHLFYLPFSSSIMWISLYVAGSHSKKNLVHYLKSYVDIIAAKYPFWNRTDGADHFLASCHDWVPSITKRCTALSIRALCNSNPSQGFEFGKDVSLPVTSVRVPENPLGGLGGKPAKKRPILAFFAGNMHGYVRPILLEHWENRYPDMKITGPLPRGVKGIMTYGQYMKTSKYCICARGYEVHSPRVMEAIFYECVPVIISDNYVPPFFNVLNWEAFSVVVAENDIPRLRDILVSIPKRKYLSLQMGVRKVQRHFLWHTKPVKYDLFHMILHSVWFNRVNQLRTR